MSGGGYPTRLLAFSAQVAQPAFPAFHAASAHKKWLPIFPLDTPRGK